MQVATGLGRIVLAACIVSRVSGGLFDAVSICGNYCGPGWCDGAYSSECSEESGYSCKKHSSDCAEKGPTDGTCPDACCKEHDKCCGSDDERGCNSDFYDCLLRCDDGPAEDRFCTDGQGGVSALLIWQGMELLAGDCCGHSCDGKDQTVQQPDCSWWSCSYY
eukprot:INCI3052.1.p1 GENE.INCI3052.1~~INCI3052.1.p1  ORF type:complete len:163 (-),score=22.91 INCI3052.1:495-983(-)